MRNLYLVISSDQLYSHLNMFALLLLCVSNEILAFKLSSSTVLQGSLNPSVWNSSSSEEELWQLRESDKNLLRAGALLIVILLVFSLIICLCAMYWFACWTSTCPAVAGMQSIVREGSTSISNRWRMASRLLSKPKRKRSHSDPPPSYEVILTECMEETPPPSYADALKNEYGAF